MHQPVSTKARTALLGSVITLGCACGARSGLPVSGSGEGGATVGSTVATTGATGSGGATMCGGSAPAFAWTVEDTSFEGIAADAHGRTFVKGAYWPSAFGVDTTQTLEYVLALGATGAVDWATPLPGPQMTGYGGSTRDIATNGDDAFVATGDGGMALTRVAADGHVVWQVRAKTPLEQAASVAVSRDGSSVVGGSPSETVDWGAGPLDVLAGGAGFGTFAVGFDPDGHLSWQHAWPGVSLSDLARDDAGTTFVLGTAQFADAIAPGVPTSSGDFLALLGPDGAPLALADLGYGWDPSRVEIDPDGSVVVGGLATTPVVVGGTPVDPGPGGAFVLARFGLDGGFVDVRTLASARPSLTTPALGAGCGHVAVGLMATTPISFGGPTYDAMPYAIGIGWVTSSGAFLGSVGSSTADASILSVDVDPTGAAVFALSGADAQLVSGSGKLVSAVVKPAQ